MPKHLTITVLAIALVVLPGCATRPASPSPLPPTTTPAPQTAVPTEEPAHPSATSTDLPSPTKIVPVTAAFDPLPEEVCLSAGLPAPACSGVLDNKDWTPVMREVAGVRMVLVPAGCFNMGYEDNFPEERPVHAICIEQPFWIDLTETTVAQFADFLNGQGQAVESTNDWLKTENVVGEPHIQLILKNGSWKPMKNMANQPVKNLTWIGATAYCDWRDASLPTEAQWEYAARGPESWLYPWGNEYDGDNLLRSGFEIADVGSVPQGASWVGALDMSGSLYEWTSSLYWPYPYDPNDGREAPLEEDDGDRVFRGCPWYHSFDNEFGPRVDNVSATARHDNPPDRGLWYYGFRCIRPFDS